MIDNFMRIVRLATSDPKKEGEELAEVILNAAHSSIEEYGDKTTQFLDECLLSEKSKEKRNNARITRRREINHNQNV